MANTVNHLRMAYFPLIALLECVSASYLLTAFVRARVDSLKRVTKTDLFSYLTRSTGHRLALLAVVGTMRAVSYSYQASAQAKRDKSSQSVRPLRLHARMSLSHGHVVGNFYCFLCFLFLRPIGSNTS
ncbi:hypothetical protein MAPG_06298 [Magnaporthiopsis poae ATCC 64411]|uniref:Uncharacterized protein n=1 Tax=Magnaporthiopsis poae (strain ATCC 64411 / 73-15) TaxID=644358 RepID=A0A0C4E1N3_MAGP6|nr:hypothetical protein MAPG_06298 [Magnaporthiopsis poae ATCC 64411]